MRRLSSWGIRRMRNANREDGRAGESFHIPPALVFGCLWEIHMAFAGENADQAVLAACTFCHPPREDAVSQTSGSAERSPLVATQTVSPSAAVGGPT